MELHGMWRSSAVRLALETVPFKATLLAGRFDFPADLDFVRDRVFFMAFDRQLAN
jgi:hypothetical protein